MKKFTLYKAPFPDFLERILIEKHISCYKDYVKEISLTSNQEKYQNYFNRLKYFPFLKAREEDPKQCHVHNHLQYNYLIGNKKALFYNLKDYYTLLGKNVYNIIPLTFHIGEGGTESDAFS